MGVVYEAWDERLERRVAIKMLHPYLFAEQAVGERLLREARLAARIEHPNVIRVYGVEMVDDRLAIEMQFIEGGALPSILSTGPLPGFQAADLLGQILDALAACHSQGVIHCDLKPGNLLVSGEGQIFLSDFGIARALTSAESAAQLTPTHSGPLWGTPQYSPPEAWQGDEPTAAWDLYAAGLLAYEALSGEPSFLGRTPLAVMLEKHARALPSIATRRPELSPEFAELIDSLIAPDAQARPTSARMALDKLRTTPEFKQGLSGTEPLRPLMVPPPGTAPVPSGRLGNPSLVMPPGSPSSPQAAIVPKRRRMAMLAGLLVCVLLGAGAWFAVNPWAARVPPHPARSSDISSLLAYDQIRTFFTYDDGIHGRELWCVNHDGEPWMVEDINPGPAGSNPRWLYRSGTSGFYFSATTDAAGTELWFCSAGVPEAKLYMVKDIIRGQMGSDPQPVAVYDNLLLFYATTLNEGRVLWCTNGNGEQTAMLDYSDPMARGHPPMAPDVLPCGDHAYISNFDNQGRSLARYDFKANTISRIADVDGQWMAELNGKLIYENRDDEHGRELWTYDPQTREASLLREIVPGPGSSDPREFKVWRNLLYFQARTESKGRELWTTDGTAKGTLLASDIGHGTLDSDPSQFTIGKDRLFFKATDDSLGRELWCADGVETWMVADLRPGQASADPYNLVANGDSFYFTANDGVHGEELWSIDGDPHANTPRLVMDLWPGARSAEPHNLCWLHAQLGFFVAHVPPGVTRLFRIKVADDKSVQISPLNLPGLTPDEGSDASGAVK